MGIVLITVASLAVVNATTEKAWKDFTDAECDTYAST